MSSVGILPRFPVIPPTNLCAHHPTSVCFAAKVEPYTFFFFLKRLPLSYQSQLLPQSHLEIYCLPAHHQWLIPVTGWYRIKSSCLRPVLSLKSHPLLAASPFLSYFTYSFTSLSRSINKSLAHVPWPYLLLPRT